MATSPLPSRGPKRGRNCYVTLAFSGIPNANREEEIRSGYLTLAFSGAQERTELLRNPCVLGDPQRQPRGENQKWLPHPCLFGGPKRGRNCYATLRFWGIPKAHHESIRSDYLTRAFSGAEKEEELLRNPCILEDPQSQARGQKLRVATSGPAFSGAQKTAELLCNPCILENPQRQARGQKSEVANTPAFSGAQKRAPTPSAG